MPVIGNMEPAQPGREDTAGHITEQEPGNSGCKLRIPVHILDYSLPVHDLDNRTAPLVDRIQFVGIRRLVGLRSA